MQIRRSILATVLACSAGLAAPPQLSAQIGVQRERNAPDAYAITNARIVPVSGPAIDRGTVVIRNGVIAAVGVAVAVPGDARTIDGTGLTVYPGLIDSYGSLGIATAGGAAAQAGGRGGRGAAPAQQGGPSSAAPNSLLPPGLQPEVAATDLIHPDDNAFAGPRSAGITTALTAPASGIFIGQSAVINLAGLTAQDMLVKAPIALHIGFNPSRGGGYPNSLMGVFAALRQTLLDAQRYGEMQAAYAKNPRGTRRPENDPSLAALQPVLSRQMPVVMAASTQREIERALDLAKEFNLRPIIAGGSEAFKLADRLKAEGVPVLLSLNFPRRPTAPAPDADPEPIRVLRDRAQAPKTPAQLAQAGVRFALESGGISNWSEVLGNASRAVEAGLAPDLALRALTLTPAEILGVSDRLGTIETGKIANLTITRGDIFDRSARVTQVFIDGKPVDVRAQDATNASGSMANGSWTMTVTLDEGEKAVTLQLIQQGDVLRGTLQGAMGSAQIQNASITPAGEVHFSSTVTIASGTEEATFNGTVTGNAIRGTVQIVGHAQGTFVGTRPDAGQGGGRRGRPPQA
jgi:imidazolonepropionase-like amidohydrolase